jgi:membrane protease YdiL (CAAX protease family)
MTMLATLGCEISRRLFGVKSAQPVVVITMANLAAALMFAAIHIPQAHAFLGLSTEVLIFVIFGNGLPGFIFGWLYWRRGLIAAMVAHFGLDLVLKVILPLVSG